MYNIYKILSIVGIVTTLLTPNLVSIAQEVDGIPGTALLSQEGVKQGELANCFDIYKFQDGITLISGVDQSNYKPYDIANIGGEIVNNNPYPVTNLSVKARVLRNHPSPVEGRAKYIAVDESIILDNISLKSNERYPLKYAYTIPGNAINGEYIIQYYVYNQDRFNLAGLSFTEDIIANQTSFTVEGGGQNIYLDSTNITVDEKPNYTRGFMVQVNKDKKIPIKIPLVNPTNAEKEMEVNYKLYKWDSLLESNLVEDITQSKLVPANSKIDLEYFVDTKSDPVYYAVITAKGLSEKDEATIKDKTIAYVRFSVTENNRPRVNWVGLDKYPLQKNDEVKVMTCVHNTSNNIDEGPIKVQSIVKDSKGKELTRIDYEGQMVASISGLSNKFKASRNINKISIETSLYNANDELVDIITTNYDCNELSPESCVEESNKLLYYIIGIIVLTLSIIVGFVLVKKYKVIKQ